LVRRPGFAGKMGFEIALERLVLAFLRLKASPCWMNIKSRLPHLQEVVFESLFSADVIPLVFDRSSYLVTQIESWVSRLYSADAAGIGTGKATAKKRKRVSPDEKPTAVKVEPAIAAEAPSFFLEAFSAIVDKSTGPDGELRVDGQNQRKRLKSLDSNKLPPKNSTKLALLRLLIVTLAESNDFLGGFRGRLESLSKLLIRSKELGVYNASFDGYENSSEIGKLLAETLNRVWRNRALDESSAGQAIQAINTLSFESLSPLLEELVPVVLSSKNPRMNELATSLMESFTKTRQVDLMLSYLAKNAEAVRSVVHHNESSFLKMIARSVPHLPRGQAIVSVQTFLRSFKEMAESKKSGEGLSNIAAILSAVLAALSTDRLASVVELFEVISAMVSFIEESLKKMTSSKIDMEIFLSILLLTSASIDLFNNPVALTSKSMGRTVSKLRKCLAALTALLDLLDGERIIAFCSLWINCSVLQCLKLKQKASPNDSKAYEAKLKREEIHILELLLDKVNHCEGESYLVFVENRCHGLFEASLMVATKSWHYFSPKRSARLFDILVEKSSALPADMSDYIIDETMVSAVPKTYLEVPGRFELVQHLEVSLRLVSSLSIEYLRKKHGSYFSKLVVVHAKATTEKKMAATYIELLIKALSFAGSVTEFELPHIVELCKKIEAFEGGKKNHSITL